MVGPSLFIGSISIFLVALRRLTWLFICGNLVVTIELNTKDFHIGDVHFFFDMVGFFFRSILILLSL